jgi:hypothetical protein
MGNSVSKIYSKGAENDTAQINSKHIKHFSLTLKVLLLLGKRELDYFN